MAKNKISTYLLYAIGEILLVVIGILIAVSINDLVEKGKRRKKEKAILIQIKKDLELAKDDIERNNIILNNSFYSADLVLKHMEGNSPYHDSIGDHLAIIFPTPTFLIDLAGYESMKASEVNVMTNDSLKNQIINLFEGRLYYHRELEEITTNQFNYLLNEEGPNYFKYFMKGWNIKNGELYFGNTKPIDYQKLRFNHEFRYQVEARKVSITAIQQGSNNILRRDMMSLVEEIDKDLERFN